MLTFIPKDHWVKYTVSPNLKISEAMAMIELNHSRSVIVISPSFKLLGSLSDGDIRRSLLHNHLIQGSILNIYNQNPIFLQQGYTEDDIDLVKTNPSINLIPVVSTCHAIVDLILNNPSC